MFFSRNKNTNQNNSKNDEISFNDWSTPSLDGGGFGGAGFGGGAFTTPNTSSTMGFGGGAQGLNTSGFGTSSGFLTSNPPFFGSSSNLSINNPQSSSSNGFLHTGSTPPLAPSPTTLATSAKLINHHDNSDTSGSFKSDRPLPSTQTTRKTYVSDDDDDDDDDDDKGDEDNKFQNEPKTPINGSSNIVEDYGVEAVPGDEDLEKGERSKTSDEDAQRSKKTLGLLCCCVLILAIIGTVLGVVLGKKDDDTTTTSKAAATLAPVPVPVTPAPVPRATPLPTTAAPTPMLQEYKIPANADTYIFLSGGEDGPFGKEDSLLVQSSDNGTVSAALMGFDIPSLPSPDVLGFSPQATLVLTLMGNVGRAAVDGNATLTIDTAVIPGFSGNVEDITSNSSSFLEQLAMNQTLGPSFLISQTSGEISVDISSLLDSYLSSPSPDPGIILRKLQMPGSSKILIGLMIDDSQGNFGSVRFYSAQSKFPPRIDIDLSGTVNDCPICGEGNNVTNPDMELELPQLGNVTCGELDYIASSGAVSEENCALLQPYINRFCCMDNGGGSNGNATDGNATDGTGTDGSAKIFVCELCVDGGNITNPTTILPITGQPNKTCAEYNGMAMQGMIPMEMCAPLQLISDTVCCGIQL